MLEFEKTTALVTTGIYRYIRHPMYSSLLFLAWGVFFKSPSWADGLIVAVATLALLATARTEEAEDLRFFGEAYREYTRRSKRFIPFIF
jgi:protein-S-isoprenylcysteine O-methyltransferase Ste14